jgi:hypothetical protein
MYYTDRAALADGVKLYSDSSLTDLAIPQYYVATNTSKYFSVEGNGEISKYSIQCPDPV